MKTALYIGNHKTSSLEARLFHWFTVNLQKGPYKHVSHVEAIHAEHDNGEVTIASASYRDGGVRSKRCKLNPAHWVIVDVPMLDVGQSIAYFKKNDGKPYDKKGAWATLLPGNNPDDKEFCSESFLASVGVPAAGTFGPHHVAAIAFWLGSDITVDFFRGR